MIGHRYSLQFGFECVMYTEKVVAANAFTIFEENFSLEKMSTRQHAMIITKGQLLAMKCIFSLSKAGILSTRIIMKVIAKIFNRQEETKMVFSGSL